MSDPSGRDIDVLVLGDARPDLWLRGTEVEEIVFDDRGHPVDDAALELGGGGAVTAVALARLGERTAFAGLVGDDAWGRFVRDALEAEGVDVSGLHVRPGAETGVSVVLKRGSGRAILVAAGAVEEFDGSVIPTSLLERSRHVHVASYFALTGLQPDVPELFASAKGSGATTSIDPGNDPTGRWNSGLLSVLDRTDVLFPNSAELRQVTGIDDVDVAAESLAERGTTLAVKFGLGGGMVLRGGDSLHVEAVPVDVVDRAGAGAAFDAGFLVAWIDDEPPERCLRIAVACGSHAVRAAGAIGGLPTRDSAFAASGAS
jgi:sugar/nucleoside kinase (ribokinase family)